MLPGKLAEAAVSPWWGGDDHVGDRVGWSDFSVSLGKDDAGKARSWSVYTRFIYAIVLSCAERGSVDGSDGDSVLSVIGCGGEWCFGVRSLYEGHVWKRCRIE